MRKLSLNVKLRIGAICLLLIMLVFTINVIKKYKVKNDKIVLRDEKMISSKEAKHLLYYLGVEEGDLLEDSEYLKFEDLSYILPSIGNEFDLDMNILLEDLSFQIQDQKGSKAILVSEFLEIYEALLEKVPANDIQVKEEELFIVGVPDKYKQDPDKEVLSTNKGNFDYENVLDFGDYYINGDLLIENGKTSIEDYFHEFDISNYINYKISAVVAGRELVYIKGKLDVETVIHNAWIEEGSGQTVNSFVHEVSKEFKAKSSLSEEIKDVVGDLIIKDGEIIGISIKPDRINGKVLVTDKEYIEVEGYGQIPLDENYKIYKIYGELAQELTNNILVGYETTDFIVAEGKIVAALIKEEMKAENIRVLIKTNKFGDYYHDQVSFTSNSEFTVTSASSDEKVVTHPPGTEISLKVGDESMDEGRIAIKPTSESGKIQLLSLERSAANPSYRGWLEIAPSENGLIIINELPLEEYLYAVVPSEMPSSYGIEALKSQAVCARSYAYNHLMANSLKEYGAHVDDSVLFQVYNNIEENEATIMAVKDTYGQVMTYGDSVISAYYFSTSSGHTASVGEVWGGSEEYLTGKPQIITKEDDIIQASIGNEVDFSNEKTFREFMINPSHPTYDSEFAWYRWKVTLSFADLTKSINSKISARYNANPEYIQTLASKAGEEEIYEKQAVESIGNLKDIQILKREKSGIITQVKLVGSNKTVKVIGEYNIRTLLSPENQVIIRQDDSEVKQSMLPSAFFVMDKAESDLIITGGGYGHGVGMSQNGAKAMADTGKEYEEILEHYYSGISLGNIYK